MLASAVALGFALLAGLSFWNRGASHPILKARRVVLVIAHPDDECMFFGPTILALRKADAEIDLLCLSEGSAGRCKELEKSSKVLGIKDVECGAFLPDGPEHEWAVERIVELATKHVHGVDAILTFDFDGVSGHANHIAIPKALLSASLPPIWILKTPKTGKYFGFLGFYLFPHGITIRSATFDYFTILRAMSQHTSQLVWFRYLYLAFSSLLWVNVLEPLHK